MSSIGGPGGIGGPKGPDGPDAVDTIDDPHAVTETRLDATLTELRAGSLTPREAIDRMVEEAGAGLGQAERAELRELIIDLVANDPYLSSLVGRV